jgi:ABC-type tungstate transport system substrate-binding protein
MSDFSTAIATALTLIASNDAELREIVFLSLEVSLTARFAPWGSAHR